MSFGKKILEKYGYKDGSGLGKNKQGITEPIRATFKFDNAGLGDKGPVREDHWWERVYNEASTNINVNKSEEGKIQMDLHDEDGVEITNKSYSMKKLKESNTSLQYGSFLKSATLLANVGKEEEIEGHVSTADIEIKPIQVLTDEDLFKACNGRTAHKGARHGINLNGKLKRIAEQERLLLEKMKSTKHKHDVFKDPNPAKRYKKNPLAELNSSKDESSDDVVESLVNPDDDYVLKKSGKRKKQDKKRETVLVTRLDSILLDESHLQSEPEHIHIATPMRKPKKSQKSKPALQSLQEIESSETEATAKKSKKKKSKKRRLDLELSPDVPEHCEEKSVDDELKKPKKIKIDESYEASETDEDIVDKLNILREDIDLKRKLNKKQKKNKKKRTSKKVTNASNILEELVV